MTEIAVDLEAGFTEDKGAFFRREARKQPDKQFVVLGTTVKEKIGKKKSFFSFLSRPDPTNLNFIPWEAQETSALPLASGSVDKLYTNMIWGAIYSEKLNEVKPFEERVEVKNESQIKIFEEVRRVLKAGGVLHMIEIEHERVPMKQLLISAGFDESKIQEKPFTRESYLTNERKGFKNMGMLKEWVISK